MTPRLPILALLFAGSAALAKGAEEGRDLRTDLQSSQAVLDRAVAEVSRPSVHFVLGGREAARGYRVKGVGVFFVLPPRALPTRERGRVIVVDRGGPQTIVRKLSKAQAQELRALQAQAEAMQREAEAAQMEAERALESVERNVRIRLDARGGPGAPPPPAPPAAPEPPEAPELALSAEAPEAPPPPPWTFWFGTNEPSDDRTPERIIGDVQTAITAALEGVGRGLPAIPAEEAILVAVDFLPTRGFDLDEPSGPVRSLIVKVKKRDLDERTLGKISPEELRRRIEYTQY